MANMNIKKSFGPSGLADVRVLKTAIRVIFDDGDTYDIVPDKGTEIVSGKYHVGLSSDKTKILSLKPTDGQYIMRFHQVGNRNPSGIPTNKIQKGGPRQSKDGKKKWMAMDSLVWIANCEILEGVSTNGIYGGLKVSTNLAYCFTPPMIGDIADFSDSSRNLERIERFFRAVTNLTISEINIPFSPDSSQMLLSVEKFIQSHLSPFMGTIQNGFIDLDSLSPVPAELVPGLGKASKKAKSKK